MPRESGASSIPETAIIHREAAAYWIARWSLSSGRPRPDRVAGH